MGLLRQHRDKQSACQCRCRKRGFHPQVGKIPWRRKWQPTPVLLPGKFHGQRNLVCYGAAKSWIQLGRHAQCTERNLFYVYKRKICIKVDCPNTRIYIYLCIYYIYREIK